MIRLLCSYVTGKGANMMLKVICEENCGNAPKKQLLKDFNIAMAKCDIA